MRTRPGPSLEEDEILAAMLGDTVDALDALMDPKLDDVTATLRYIRTRLERHFDAETGERK